MTSTSVPRYPSDLTREQFERVRPLLEAARQKTKPRTLDLYDIFNGLLYILKTGCQWRLLPHDYPKWRTVHEYFLIWSEKNPKTEKTTIEEVLKKIGRRRTREVRPPEEDGLYDRGCPECKKYGFCDGEGI